MERPTIDQRQRAVSGMQLWDRGQNYSPSLFAGQFSVTLTRYPRQPLWQKERFDWLVISVHGQLVLLLWA